MLSSGTPAPEERPRTLGYRNVIPVGRPYLTKVNGQLVFARDKLKGCSKPSLGLLGEAFGMTTKAVHRSLKPIDRSPNGPTILKGIACVPQVQNYQPTASALQQPFLGLEVQTTQYQVQQQTSSSTTPQPTPTKKELKQLTMVNMHFNRIIINRQTQDREQAQVMANRGDTTMVIMAKHICAGCGRSRSSKYHHENIIKDGEPPVPSLCRKCKTIASSTSSHGSEEQETARRVKNCMKSKIKDSQPNKLVGISDQKKAESSESSHAEVSGKVTNFRQSKVTTHYLIIILWLLGELLLH